MGRRNGYNNTLILRGESPEFDDDDEFGMEPDGDEFDDEFGEGGQDDMAFKGRRVNGPRTKLSASMDARLNNMETGIARLAKGMTYFGQYLKSQSRKAQLAKHGMPGEEPGGGDEFGGMGGYEEEEDPMAIPPEDGEDHLDLAAGPQLRATGEGTNLNVRKAKLGKARVTKGQLQQAVAVLRKAGYIVGQSGVVSSLVSKDDAASSFGEKDSNAPGNRPFDTEDVGEDDTVIQGGPGAGPGPVSKAQLSGESFDARIQKAVMGTMGAVLDAYGLQQQRPVQMPEASGARVMKAVSPGPGGAAGFDTKIDNAAGPDLNELFDSLRKQSWGSINRLRVEVGDLTSGIL